MLRKTFNYVVFTKKTSMGIQVKGRKICSHLNTLCLFYEKSIKCSICEKKFSSLTLILKSISFSFGIGLRPIVSQAYCSVQAYCEKCSFGHSLLESCIGFEILEGTAQKLSLPHPILVLLTVLILLGHPVVHAEKPCMYKENVGFLWLHESRTNFACSLCNIQMGK